MWVEMWVEELEEEYKEVYTDHRKDQHMEHGKGQCTGQNNMDQCTQEECRDLNRELNNIEALFCHVYFRHTENMGYHKEEYNMDLYMDQYKMERHKDHYIQEESNMD